MRFVSQAILGLVLVAGALLGGCVSPQIRLQQEGVALLDQKHYPQALDKFKAALKYDEFNAVNNYYAGAAELQLGHLEQAEYHLKTAWQADPSLPEVKNALTETLLRQNKKDAALDFLERDAEYTAKVRDPRDERSVEYKRRFVNQPEERMYLGKAGDRLRIAQTYERIGDFDSARVYFAQARTMDPGNIDILMAQALFFDRIGSKDEAVPLLKEVYRRAPGYPGLVPVLTRNGVMISDLLAAPHAP